MAAPATVSAYAAFISIGCSSRVPEKGRDAKRHESGNLPMSHLFSARLRRAAVIAERKSMKKKVLSVVLALAVTTTLFSACATATEETTTTAATAAQTEETTTTAEETTAADDSIYPLTYTDAYGNEVTIESEPETVVSVSPALTEIVFALGAQDKLVGRSSYDDYPAEVFDIQDVGPIDLPDTELIASLEPDVVIASSIFSEEAYNAITELGIPVVIIRDETTLTGMFGVIADVADVIGAHEEGEALVAELQAELDEITDNVAEEEPSVSVYYCMGYGEYGDYTAGGDTFINDIITTAGAINAAGDVSGWSYSQEALLEADPDYILVPSWGYDAFLETEPYSSLTAVQEGRVIAVDSNMFERQGPRNLDAVILIQEAISGANASAAETEADAEAA